MKNKSANNNEISSAGKKGAAVRSDCYIEIRFKKTGGINVQLQSKIKLLYGESIRSQLIEMCNFFGIKHLQIYIEDKGALPFVIAARFESAIKELFDNLEKDYLPPFNKKNSYSTSKDRLRRSRLYLPGNEPKYFINAGLHKPDCIILDLEDSVAPSEKKAARILVRNTLCAIDFYGAERMVRINQLPAGLDELKFIVPHNVHVILIPKCESADQIKQVEEKVNDIKVKFDIENEIYFMPIIESALGIIKAFEIASASKQNCALAIGLEDYTSDLGVQRTKDGRESLFARGMIVNAAKAAGIQAIDTVFSDINDMEGLKESVLEAKSLGFEGKGCIHPRQIPVIHNAFTPSLEEIKDAKKIIRAYEEAKKKGVGVISLGGKMIDVPVVKRAQKIIQLALLYNLLSED